MKKMMTWRVVDIVVAAVLGVACGLLFWVWNSIGYAWYTAAQAITPGSGCRDFRRSGGGLCVGRSG